MKKKLIIFITIILSIVIVGCSNKNEEQYEDAMSNGKSSVVEEEYNKAIDYFKLALEYKEDDQEATNLIKQLKLLKETKDLEEEGAYFKQIKNIDKINSIKTETNVVKEKANEYKETVLKNIDNEIDYIEEEIEDAEYKKAQEDIEGIIKECKGNDTLKDQLDRCNKLLDTCKEKKKEAEEQAKKEEQSKKEAEQKQVSSNSNGSFKKSSANSNKVYCSKGNHYVKPENYSSDIKCCHKCEMEQFLKEVMDSIICEYCGERRVSMYTGKCRYCGKQNCPGVSKIYEDGTVVYKDGTVDYYDF